MQLDDWVLCRIYNKKGAIEKQQPAPPPPSGVHKIECYEMEDVKPEYTAADCLYFEASDSVPRLHTTESSCSEQVVSAEFASEVQSEPKRGSNNNNEFAYNYVDATLGNNQMSPLQDIFMYLSKSFCN